MNRTRRSTGRRRRGRPPPGRQQSASCGQPSNPSCEKLVARVALVRGGVAPNPWPTTLHSRVRSAFSWQGGQGRRVEPKCSPHALSMSSEAAGSIRPITTKRRGAWPCTPHRAPPQGKPSSTCESPPWRRLDATLQRFPSRAAGFRTQSVSAERERRTRSLAQRPWGRCVRWRASLARPKMS